MEKQMVLRLISLLILVTVTAATIPVIDKSPKAVAKWFKNLPHAKQKTTKLHYYFHATKLQFHNHEIITRDNDPAPVVAQANTTLQSPTFFGLLRINDNPLTVGPEPDSKQVGRAQGIQGYASMTEVGMLMNMNLVFTDGPFNGSTLSVLGRVAESQVYRELSIIGGSGVFRLARGVATSKRYFANNERVTFEYHVIVLHY